MTTDTIETRPHERTIACAQFLAGMSAMQTEAWKTAVEKGFRDNPPEFGTCIALMHSELSEALEAMRHGNPESEKIPGYSHVEEEFADVLIRMLDNCEAEGWNLAGATLAKMAFNKTRSHKHGGKAF